MENCGSCRADDALTADNAGMVVYLDYLPANHVWATCTHGGARDHQHPWRQGWLGKPHLEQAQTGCVRGRPARASG